MTPRNPAWLTVMHIFSSATLFTVLHHRTVDAIQARKCAIQARNLEEGEKTEAAGEAPQLSTIQVDSLRTFQ
jgi:hypothetical protein